MRMPWPYFSGQDQHADGTPPCPVGREPLCLGILALSVFSCWSFSSLLASQTSDHAVKLARLSISKDLALRAWVADLGGLYAPVTPARPPIPGWPLKTAISP